MYASSELEFHYITIISSFSSTNESLSLLYICIHIQVVECLRRMDKHAKSAAMLY